MCFNKIRRILPLHTTEDPKNVHKQYRVYLCKSYVNVYTQALEHKLQHTASAIFAEPRNIRRHSSIFQETLSSFCTYLLEYLIKTVTNVRIKKQLNISKNVFIDLCFTQSQYVVINIIFYLLDDYMCY